MNNKINSISNEFEKAVRTAEEKLLAGKISGFSMYCSYAEGIFYAMFFHEKMEELPMNSIRKLKRIGKMVEEYDDMKDFKAGLKKEKRVEIPAKTFALLMHGIDDDYDVILSKFGMAKGILLVMQGLGTAQKLDKQLVDVHRDMAESLMEMMDASDNMYDFLSHL